MYKLLFALLLITRIVGQRNRGPNTQPQEGEGPRRLLPHLQYSYFFDPGPVPDRSHEFVKISFCRSSQSYAIHQATIEVQRALWTAYDRLRELETWIDDQSPHYKPWLKPLWEQSFILASTFWTYRAFIDRDLVRRDESTDKLFVPEQAKGRLFNLTRDLGSMLDYARRKYNTEITCGSHWILRVDLEGNPHPDDSDLFFDNRTSIPMRMRTRILRKPFRVIKVPDSRDRWMKIIGWDPDTVLKGQPYVAQLLTRMHEPFPTVLVLDEYGWDLWKRAFKGTGNGHRITAISLTHLRHNVPPGAWFLPDIMAQGLTPLLITMLAQSNDWIPLQKGRVYQPPSPNPLDSVAGYTQGAADKFETILSNARLQPKEPSRYFDAMAFGYLVTALFLNNTDWSLGLNRNLSAAWRQAEWFKPPELPEPQSGWCVVC